MENSGSLFAAFLNSHDDEKWQAVIDTLLPVIHEVDRRATQIWLSFYPLALLRALQEADDVLALIQKLRLKGSYLLVEQIDASHHFLYGHRYWAAVKEAVTAFALSAAAPKSLELAAQIQDVADAVAKKIQVDATLLTGITAVAFMTLQQVGIEEFQAASGEIHISKKVASKTPEQVLRQRAHDPGQGFFGFLHANLKHYKITFNENVEDACFPLISTQHLTTGAATDKRDYHTQDPRCIVGEGPIPVECRSAACGTCWVGILGGNANVSRVADLEYHRIKEFGYLDSEERKPVIRLACMTQAEGPVSIVIPPWNGVFGKYLRLHKEQQARSAYGKD
ncbi:MAG: (2Fe-2S)-binding protein [Acidobacteria bacterium]|nr:(2Fe-2S)-binding protein [Acidobacteriota bacterium]